MIIGVPKEIKAEEFRVAITPAGVKELTADRHQVLIESTAGDGSGFSDEECRSAAPGSHERGGRTDGKPHGRLVSPDVQGRLRRAGNRRGGVKPGRAVILGAGVVGLNAARVAMGLGMETVVLNKGEERAEYPAGKDHEQSTG